MIHITQGKVALVDKKDFKKLSKYKWYFGCKGYAVRSQRYKTGKNGKTILMHREILGQPKETLTDHINGNKLDNRKCNLREVTYKQNFWNSRKSKKNTSGYKGVVKSGKKWIAQIAPGRHIYLGIFGTPEEAALAYNKAAKKYFGEFARLNILKELAE